MAFDAAATADREPVTASLRGARSTPLSEKPVRLGTLLDKDAAREIKSKYGYKPHFAD